MTISQQDSDRRDEFDVVIVGSGAGAMTAALRAHDNGLSVLAIEKSDVYGGTTAVSGGGIWIPCNDQIAALGGGTRTTRRLPTCRTWSPRILIRCE
jgi:3-oxosteroid 1-dehydrogenase